MDGFEVALVVALLVFAAWYGRPSHRSLFRAGLGFAYRYRLLIDDDFAALVMRAERWAWRAHALVLAVAAVVFAIAFQAPYDNVMAVLPPVGAAVVAARFVVGVAWAGREFPVAPGRPSVARVRVVRPSDLVHPVAWCCFVVWFASALGAIVVGIDRHQPAAAVTGATVALTVVAAVAVIMAWCRRPEPAADAAHLFLQDAWRASRIQQSLLELAVVGWVLAQVTYHGLGPESGGWQYLPLASGWAPLLALAVGRDRFRRRLWPELPATQVVVVGATP
ncbi:hypothetical protein GCM10022237_41820 [Nocardioides ginsengisoli]|uniref:Uncharacterized protein n=1 Tax=Nocardioides ginsengisoli TaxID=363868 RepID=A0ABW3W4G9_9ACTN